MDIFYRIAERKITEAIERGEFDDLALKGTKLDFSDIANTPAELRMGYKILKNAGILPEELALGQEIRTLNGLLEHCVNDESSKDVQMSVRNKLLQLNILMEKRGRSVALQDYLARLEER